METCIQDKKVPPLRLWPTLFDYLPPLFAIGTLLQVVAKGYMPGVISPWQAVGAGALALLSLYAGAVSVALTALLNSTSAYADALSFVRRIRHLLLSTAATQVALVAAALLVPHSPWAQGMRVILGIVGIVSTRSLYLQCKNTLKG